MKPTHNPDINLSEYIRSVPDFPKPGISFYDITTLMREPIAFREALNRMEAYVRDRDAERIVGIEARGFIFGAALADRLKIGFAPARKPGKLPYKTVSQEYSLEYGTDKVEMHIDGITKHERVVIVDDLIATGGTLKATCQLVEQLGGEVVGITTVIELSFLPWRTLLKDYDVNYLMTFDSE